MLTVRQLRGIRTARTNLNLSREADVVTHIALSQKTGAHAVYDQRMTITTGAHTPITGAVSWERTYQGDYGAGGMQFTGRLQMVMPDSLSSLFKETSNYEINFDGVKLRAISLVNLPITQELLIVCERTGKTGWT